MKSNQGFMYKDYSSQNTYSSASICQQQFLTRSSQGDISCWRRWNDEQSYLRAHWNIRNNQHYVNKLSELVLTFQRQYREFQFAKKYLQLEISLISPRTIWFAASNITTNNSLLPIHPICQNKHSGQRS